MLRRKLLLLLGPLVGLLLVTAVVAIALLQSVLSQMDHISVVATGTVAEANDLGRTIALIEVDLYELRTGKKRHLDTLLDAYQQLESQIDRIGQRYIVNGPVSRGQFDRLTDLLPTFRANVASLATAQDPRLASGYNQKLIDTVAAMRGEISAISEHAGEHAEQEQRSLSRQFKWVVLGLSLIFLVVINVSVIVLLRMAGLVLKPVDKLVAATHELANERFDYRVELDQKDEFDNLAQAYNSLAQQLQANEQRRLETLGQVALTLNHELNNALAIIELQLGLLSRQTGGNPAMEKHLRQIRESLGRMASTVEQLKHVRRIVLTDYVAGAKMLDLKRSVEAEAEPAPAGPRQ